MTEIEKRILENQEVILLSLSRLLVPYDQYSTIKTNNGVIDCYQLTRKMLGKDYIERYSKEYGK